MTTNRQGRRRRHRLNKARAALRHGRPCAWLDRHPAPRPSRREFRTAAGKLALQIGRAMARVVLRASTLRQALRSAVGRFAVDAVTLQMRLHIAKWAALYRTPRRRHGD